MYKKENKKRKCKKSPDRKKAEWQDKRDATPEFVTKMKKNFKNLKFFFLYMPFCYETNFAA